MPQLGSLVPVAVVILAVIAGFVMLQSLFRLYVKVPPNKAAVFYGRKSKTADGKVIGAKVVSGGGKFRIPLLESVDWLDLGVMSIELDVKKIPNVDGIEIDVQGVANVKIKSDEVSLAAAAERFLGMRPTEVKDIAHQNLLGHLRGILGKMTVEELIRTREKFNEVMLREAADDLSRMGLQIDLLNIQEIKDQQGYITALGKPKSAQVQRDAQVGEAKNKSEGDQQAAIANQQARTVEAKAAADIAEAEKDRDTRKAQFSAEVAEAQARSAQAGPLATAKATQEVVQQQTTLAQREAEKREAELVAEIVKPAAAAKAKVVIEAEAAQEQTVLAAKATKERQQLEGEGEAAKIEAIGKAKGAALRAELEGEAAGILKKAEAMKQLDESARVLLILEKLPSVLEKLTPIASAIATPMGNIDKVNIYDFGGDGQGPAKFAGNVTKLLFAAVEQLKGMGFDPSALLGSFAGSTGKVEPEAAPKAVAGGKAEK